VGEGASAGRTLSSGFAALFVLLCAVKRFALEILYSVPGFFDLFGDEI
jgi:hypothetical protein